jgi:PilZ domain-containing protein
VFKDEMNAQSTPITSIGVRRSGRIPKEIPILFTGADAAGRQFSEQTKTLLLSRHGASLISRYKLIPEQEAYLRTLSNNREIEVRVCGEIGEREDGHIYGVAFADVTVEFWGIEFPPPERLNRDIVPVTIECSGCHAQKTVQFDATEMDVYAVNEGALRYCTVCSISTIWKIAPKRMEREQAPAVEVPAAGAPLEVILPLPQLAPAPALSAPEPPPPAKAAQPNRRRDRRMKVKCNACIRTMGSPDEITLCEDMSRGGFSFQSARQYSVEALIEAAVPYTPGATSIFVPAQIANVRELQRGKLYRYGVAYVRGPRS